MMRRRRFDLLWPLSARRPWQRYSLVMFVVAAWQRVATVAVERPPVSCVAVIPHPLSVSAAPHPSVSRLQDIYMTIFLLEQAATAQNVAYKPVACALSHPRSCLLLRDSSPDCHSCQLLLQSTGFLPNWRQVLRALHRD